MDSQTDSHWPLIAGYKARSVFTNDGELAEKGHITLQYGGGYGLCRGHAVYDEAPFLRPGVDGYPMVYIRCRCDDCLSA